MFRLWGRHCGAIFQLVMISEFRKTLQLRKVFSEKTHRGRADHNLDATIVFFFFRFESIEFHVRLSLQQVVFFRFCTAVVFRMKVTHQFWALRKPCVVHDWPSLPSDAKAEFDVWQPRESKLD